MGYDLHDLTKKTPVETFTWVVFGFILLKEALKNFNKDVFNRPKLLTQSIINNIRFSIGFKKSKFSFLNKIF